LLGLETIDNRAALFNIEGLITGDRYIFVRDAYLQHREYQINGEAPPRPTGMWV
jgi:phospholipid-binding lipoprotein MlaA